MAHAKMWIKKESVKGAWLQMVNVNACKLLLASLEFLGIFDSYICYLCSVQLTLLLLKVLYFVT